MAKILMIADGHLSLKINPDEIEVILRTVTNTLGEKNIFSRLLHDHYDRQRESHLKKALSQAVKKDDCEMIISLGDLTPGRNYGGIIDPEAYDEAIHFLSLLAEISGVSPSDIIKVPGNHDLGYHYSTWAWGSTWPDSTNFEAYKKAYGSLYGYRLLTPEFMFIYLSPVHVETLAYRPGKISDEKLDFLITKQTEELEFLEQTLAQNGQLFFLGIHDPGTFISPQLEAVINPHRERLVASFTGHVHAQWVLDFIKMFRPSFRPAFKKYRLQFVPSIWGAVLPFLFWPTGAGWGRLILDGGKADLELRQFDSPKINPIALWPL